MTSIVVLALLSSMNIQIEKLQEGTVRVSFYITTQIEQEKVVEVLRDVENYRAWMPMVDSATVITGSEAHDNLLWDKNYYAYTTLTLPFPVGKCDQVTNTTETFNKKTATFTQRWKALPGYLPEKSGYRRIEVSEGIWSVKKSADSTEIRYEAIMQRPPLPWFMVESAIRSNTEKLLQGLLSTSSLMR